MLAARKMKMEEELSRARVVHPQDVPAGTVGIGSRVLLKRISDGVEVEMAFLGPWDADHQKGIYSYQARVAQDLMGRPAGEELILRIEGAEDTYRIEKIWSALG